MLLFVLHNGLPFLCFVSFLAHFALLWQGGYNKLWYMCTLQLILLFPPLCQGSQFSVFQGGTYIPFFDVLGGIFTFSVST